MLDAVPAPVFGIDDEGLLVFANAPAETLCGLTGDMLGGPATERLPQTLWPALAGDSTLVTLAGRRWWAVSRHVGGDAPWRLLVLLPQAGAEH